jgi:hypothetical protein
MTKTAVCRRSGFEFWSFDLPAVQDLRIRERAEASAEELGRRVFGFVSEFVLRYSDFVARDPLKGPHSLRPAKNVGADRFAKGG